MADVYGSIGDQLVELNNAASEATLKALLEVAKAQFSKDTKGKGAGADVKAYRDLEKRLKELAKTTTNLTKTKQTQQRVQQESIKVEKQSIRATRQTIDQQTKLNKSHRDYGAAIASTINQLANMSNSISGATSVLSSFVKQIPLVGGMLGGLMDSVAGAIEKTQNSFIQASSVGANFGASINTMIRSASGAGLTIDQFTGIISRTGPELALLGQGSANGAKMLARFGKEIRTSPFQDQLANLGYSTEEVNEGLAIYGARLRRTGMSQEQINATLVESTANYLKNLDAVSKLTGQSKKELEAQRKARRDDAKFRYMLRNQDAKAVEAMDTFLDGLDQAQQKAFIEIAATGTAQNEAAKTLFYQSPEMAQNALKVFKQLGSGGQLTMSMMETMHSSAQREARSRMTQNDFFARYGNETQQQLALSSAKLADQTTTLSESMAQSAETANRQSKEFGEMSPAELVRTQQEIAESSNEMTRTLLRFSDTLLASLRGFNNLIQGAVGYIDDFSKWISKIVDKFKDIYKMFEENSTLSLLGKLADTIFDGMKLGVGYLIDKAIEIGERIGTGFVNNIPDWLKKMLGVEEKTSAEIKRDALEKQLKDETDPAKKAELEKQLKLANQQIESSEEKRLKNELDKQLSYYSMIEDESSEEALFIDKKIKELQTKLKEAELKRKGLTSKQLDLEGGVADGVQDVTPKNVTPPQYLSNTDQIQQLEKKIKLYQENELGARQDLVRAMARKDEAAIKEHTAEQAHYENLLNEATVELEKARNSLPKTEKAIDNNTQAINSWVDTEGGVAEGIQNSVDAMNKQREEDKKAQQAQIQATEDNTDATKANTKETKAASACELDYSSPQALFNSFAKIMVGGKPGVTDSMTGASVAKPTTTGEDEMFSSVGPSSMSNYLKTVAMLESSGNPLAKAGTSSASGLFQFTKGTWEQTVKEMGKNYSLEDRFDPAKATEVMEFFTQKQKSQLEGSLGRSASDVDMYMAHFLGAGGASKFLKAMGSTPEASAADIVGDDAAKANKGIFYKNGQARSLKEVYDLMARKYQRQESNVMAGNVPGTVSAIAGIKNDFNSITPSTAQATTAISPETVSGRTTTSEPGPGAPAAVSTAASNQTMQTDALNTQVAQLLSSNKELVDVARQQLRALRGISGDSFMTT